MTWITSPAHHRWLEAETDRLLAFGRGARAEHGFGWLDREGRLEDRPTEVWITCRMTYVFSLGALLGRPGCGPLVDHGLEALRTWFHDGEHGGWFHAVADGAPVGDGGADKGAYAHAFVVLATATATAAGRPGARALLDEALALQLEHFWDDEAGMVVESWDRTFTACEGYRGVNANMHTVEAYLAAAAVTGDRAWLDRAARITDRVLGFARGNAWRLPEHFDEAWNPLPDYNADAPAHPFRPYGATIGHWFEWARLALHVGAALEALGDVPPASWLDDARGLVEAGVAQGWAVDGAPGFVYTVDWQGRPVVRERMHWVLCEALGAAAALHHATGEERWDTLYRAWWDEAEAHFLDPDGGSWWHELGTDNRPSATVWGGKADLYHAVQATLLPRLPLAPVLGPALASGALA